MLLSLEILSMLTMLTIMFVLIWGFILLKKIFGQLKYKNYLMEKLIQSISVQNKADIETKYDK